MNFSFNRAAAQDLDKSDVQQFEQGYESWVQNTVQKIIQKNPVTVLIELNYTKNPDALQSYEERRAANHLPGLPEMSDPHFNTPQESPISELISSQSIKLIFEQELTTDQMRVINEVLAVKLKLDLSHGDKILFDHLRTQITPRPSRNRTDLYLILFFILVSGVVLVLIAKNKFNSKFNNKLEANKSEATSEPNNTTANNTTANNTPANNTTINNKSEEHIQSFYQKVNPIKTILKSDPKTLLETIQKQDHTFLLSVIAHAPLRFNQMIFKICEPEKRFKLLEAYKNNRHEISQQKSRYSQILLAAKIHDQMKMNALQQIDVLNESQLKSQELKKKMKESLKQIKASLNSPTPSDEVNHENSL